MPGPAFGNRKQCPECRQWTEADRTRCPNCLFDLDAPPAPTYADLQRTQIHVNRLTEYGNHWFIAKRNLDLFDDYAYSEVGDIIVVQSQSGRPIFFELAAFVEGWGEDPEPSFMILRIDPDTSWPKDWKVLDVDPEEAVILRLDKAKKKGGASD